MSYSEFEEADKQLRDVFESRMERSGRETRQKWFQKGYDTSQVVISGTTHAIGADFVDHYVEVLRRSDLLGRVVVLNSVLIEFDQMSGGGKDLTIMEKELDPELLEAHLQELSGCIGLPLDKKKIQAVDIL